jgi:transporter family-2 protein
MHALPSVALQRALGLLAAFVTGTGISLQGRINSALAARLDDGLVAALISFGTGFVLLTLLALVLPQPRRGLRRIRAALAERRLRWWHLTGGFCGALLVASQGLTIGMLGVAVFTVAVVGGQIGSSLVIDRLGVGPGGRRPISTQRLAGAALAICAVGLAVSDRLAHPGGLVLALLPFVAGIASAWQQGVNGQVGVTARDGDGGALLVSALPATLINFTTGAAVLAVVAGVGVLGHGMPNALPPQPWLYLGGSLGIAFIGSMVVLVRRIGVLVLGLGMVAGQLVASLLLDLFAPSGAHPLTLLTVIGTALTLVAAGIAAWSGGAAAAEERDARMVE